MWHNRLYPILAVLGLCSSFGLMVVSLQKPPVKPILFEPARAPYEHYLAAEGVVESLIDNINLGVAFSDVITEVYHCVGDKVQKGEPLFKVDTRRFEAERGKAQEEERYAKIDLAAQEKQFSYYQRLKDRSAVSEQLYTSAQYDYERAKIRLASATASVNLYSVQIERAITRAPCDGQILQAGHAKVGEYANVNPFDNVPIMIFGVVNHFQLRIDIDESDAWRYKKNARAIALVRGNPQIQFPLVFRHIEPLMIPKKSLTGTNRDLVDTRVLQVLYEFDQELQPVYLGQVLDVFIEADPLGGR